MNFEYRLRKLDVVFGVGALARLGTLAKESLGATRVLLVSTPRRIELTAAARAALGDLHVASFDRARLHVPLPIVDEAHAVLRSSESDCVVAIGGGSPIGLGKMLARETGLPLVAIPTTYSGSEMTDIWGVTDEDGKHTGRDSRVAPRLVIYEPRLTKTLPAGVAATSGINAIAHAVEALYSTTANPVSSAFAVDGIRQLATSLPRLVQAPARDGIHETPSEVYWQTRAAHQALCGAHLCGRALDMTSMGLHHKLCHVLGGLLDLPHAKTHAVVLPHVVAYNAPFAPAAMAAVAASLDTTDAALGLWRLNQALSIRDTLADLGMVENDIPGIVEGALRMSYPNPGPVTEAVLRHILEAALTGSPPSTLGA